MSLSILSLSRGTSTLAMARSELKRIEAITGYRPVDWLMDIYDESLDDFRSDDGSFDFEGFAMHLSCVADSFIDFTQEHAQHLRMSF